jgi:hypothetical protein
MWRIIPLLAVLAILAGCKSYHYQITAPPEAATTIPPKQTRTISMPPIEYVMQTREGRLVIQVYNRGQDVLRLAGAESYVVDSRGETHPLPDGTIAPGAYIKFIIPPLAGGTYGTTSFGVGVGVGIHGAAPQADETAEASAALSQTQSAATAAPMYLQVAPGMHWEWRGEGQIRLSLLYLQPDQSFRHEFVISRQKQ